MVFSVFSQATSNMAPGVPQEGPKRASRGSLRVHDGPRFLEGGSRWPSWPQMVPRRLQEGSNRAPGVLAPRGPPEALRGPKRPKKRSQEGAQEGPRGPKRLQEAAVFEVAQGKVLKVTSPQKGPCESIVAPRCPKVARDGHDDVL